MGRRTTSCVLTREKPLPPVEPTTTMPDPAELAILNPLQQPVLPPVAPKYTGEGAGGLGRVAREGGYSAYA